MARTFADEVVETSATTGTGTYSLAGAKGAYRTFRQGYGNGDTTVYYAVRNASNSKWELNRGCTLTYGSPDTLTRGVFRSTNADAAVSWVAGDLPLTVYVPAAADVHELVVTGALSTARHALIRFGEWWKTDHPSAGWVMKYLFDGADDIPLGKLNTTQNKYIPDPAAINFPPGYIQGLTWSRNGSDTTNDIDIAPGSCADSTGVYPMKIAATLTKRLDAAWAVGSGNGGLDTGAVGNSEYAVHLIGRSDTGVIDALFSLSATAPTMPTNYDYRRHIGWIKRESAANLDFFVNELSGGGIEFRWKAATRDLNLATVTTTRSLHVLKVPTTFVTKSLARYEISDGGANRIARVCDPAETDAAVAVGSAPSANMVSYTTGGHFYEHAIRTDSQGRIALRSASGPVNLIDVYTLGFEWSRR